MARREARRALAPLELVTMDIIGPTVADCHGNVLLLTTKCVGTNYRRVVPMPDRAAPTVLMAFLELYPGSRHEAPPQQQAHADERLRPSGGPGHLRAGEGRRRAPEKFGRRQNRDAVRGQVEGLGQEALYSSST